jgi:carotenoid cleavage dioxygenase
MNAIRFPHNDFKSFEAPFRAEMDIRGLEVVQGKVPEHLDGGFYRLIGDRQWPSFVKNDIFMLNEDGMATCLRFHNGRVDFRSRYVRTPRFVAEEKAGRALFGEYRNPLTDDPSVRGLSRGVANVTLLAHAGKLLALKEDSPPVQMDPYTLETLGEYDFDGAFTSTACTAHPKIDARTGELIFYGYCAKGPCTTDIVYYEADRHGKIIHETWFNAPYTCMVHDVMVTQNFVIFPITPLRHEYEWLEKREPAFKWDPNEQVYLAVLPRKGTAQQLRWFRGPNQCHGHVVGAYDDGRYIYADNTASKRSFFLFFPNIDGSPANPEDAKPFVKRWIIDTGRAGDSFDEKPLLAYPGELPRIDTRFETLPYTWSTINLLDVPGQQRVGLGFQWVATFDVTGRKATQIYYAGDNCSIGEPQFVPAHDKATEGEGYILAVVGHHEAMRSDLLILDAQNINAPPIATVALPCRLRSTGHGYWYGTSQLNGTTNVLRAN